MTQSVVQPKGPVVGVRIWRYSLDRGVFLRGVGPCSALSIAVWRPGVMEAQCGAPALHEEMAGTNAPIPANDCECGLYAYYDWDSRRVFGYPGSPYINGIVRGWGHMDRHPDGWRAQYAEVLALVTGINKETDPRIYKVAERYKVPTVSVNSMPHILTEFGDPFPHEWRPQPRVRRGPDEWSNLSLDSAARGDK